MNGFIKGENRQQSRLFPERLDDYVVEGNPVRVVDVYIDSLDLSGLGFDTEALLTPICTLAIADGAPLKTQIEKTFFHHIDMSLHRGSGSRGLPACK